MVDSFLYISCEKTLILLLDFFFSQVQAPECRVGGARGGLHQEGSSPEQSHHQRAGERQQDVAAQVSCDRRFESVLSFL